MVRSNNNASSSNPVVSQDQGTTVESTHVDAGVVVGTISPSTSVTVPSVSMANVGSTQPEMASMPISLSFPTGIYNPYMAIGSGFNPRFPNVNVPTFPSGMYGMPTGMPHVSTMSPSHVSSESVMGRNPAALTNESLFALRQQVDESNHDMVNMLTQQIGTVFNPLIQNTNTSYQMLATQMGRIADFFGVPSTSNRTIPNIPRAAAEIPIPITVDEQPRVANHVPEVVLVNRNQNADEVVRQVQQEHVGAQDNIATLVETILTQNGVNVGLHRPNFISPLCEYVLQTELPRGWKVPKYTKFGGDTKESTVEHIARFLTESGDIAQNENLKMKYFPNSLTKNAFTWFTTLPPGSIFTWGQLEKAFHAQFYMGQSKISLKELASVRRKAPETVDDYLNRFRLLKARCFTQVPEHELVEMAAGGLDYSIRKKLDTSYLRDMAQLADRVRQVERLKEEKSRSNRFHKKEKVAYVQEEFDVTCDVEEEEIDVAELKPGPPYTCKLLRPANGKNPVEPKNDRFMPKTYTFDVTKCDEIFDVLVKDGQILVPNGLKVPTLDQRKKKGYCKFHNFLGHNTDRCVLFRDLVQRAIEEGRLKFEDKKMKATMQVVDDPLPKADAMYSEPVEAEIGMVDAKMVDVPKNTDSAIGKRKGIIYAEGMRQEVTLEEYDGTVRVVYPRAEEELIDFLKRCKSKDSEVMLCPRCSAVFDKEAAKSVEGYRIQQHNKRKWLDNRPKFDFGTTELSGYKANISTIASSSKQQVIKKKPEKKRSMQLGKSFVPKSDIPVGKWSYNNQQAVAVKQNLDVAKYNYTNNYKGKNPMTKTQWRRYQRKQKKKASFDINEVPGHFGTKVNLGDKKLASKIEAGTSADAAKPTNVVNKAKGKTVPTEKMRRPALERTRRPALERIRPPPSTSKGKEPQFDLDEDMGSDFEDSDYDFDVVCNVVSILPLEYDVITIPASEEEDFTEDMTCHKPMCYYVMNNGCVEDQMATFERPDMSMQNHLKPLYIQAKVNGVGINKVLVDGGAAVNLMPEVLMKKIGLSIADLKPHNIVLSNYEGKTGYSLGAIEVELIVGTIKRTTLFLVIASKANFNMLLGREWIHGVGAVPSTLHQKLVMWKENGLVEYIEADQSYFRADVNHVSKENFERKLANIAPCRSSNEAYIPADNVFASVNLHPNYGFVWERQIIGDATAQPEGWYSDS